MAAVSDLPRCPKCGSPNPPQWKKCYICGTDMPLPPAAKEFLCSICGKQNHSQRCRRCDRFVCDTCIEGDFCRICQQEAEKAVSAIQASDPGSVAPQSPTVGDAVGAFREIAKITWDAVKDIPLEKIQADLQRAREEVRKESIKKQQEIDRWLAKVRLGCLLAVLGVLLFFFVFGCIMPSLPDRDSSASVSAPAPAQQESAPPSQPVETNLGTIHAASSQQCDVGEPEAIKQLAVNISYYPTTNSFTVRWTAVYPPDSASYEHCITYDRGSQILVHRLGPSGIGTTDYTYGGVTADIIRRLAAKADVEHVTTDNLKDFGCQAGGS